MRKVYSFSRQVKLIVSVTSVAVFLWIGYLTYTAVSRQHYEQSLALLANVAYGFEADLNRYMAEIAAIELDSDLNRDEKVAAIHALVQPVLEPHLAHFPEVGLGYYSRSLDAVVATGPWDEMGHILGRMLNANHPSMELYYGGPIQRRIDNAVRGQVLRYARLVHWRGDPAGHIWANIMIEVYRIEILRAMVRYLPFFLLLLFGGIVLPHVIFAEIKRSTDQLGQEMDRIATETASRPLEKSQVLPLELKPLYDKFYAMRCRLDQATVELSRSTRAAAFGELAATVVHNIKNPVAVISAAAQMGLTSAEMNATNKHSSEERFQQIIEVSDELSQYIDSMLNLTALDASSSEETVSLHCVVKQSVGHWQPLLDRRSIQLELQIPERLPLLNCRRAVLQHMLLNLVKNAAEAMSNGGSLIISVKEMRSLVEIRVSDTGEGIPVSVQPLVFTPFFSTKAGGTGVGLAWVQTMANQLGGGLRFTTVPGEGTTFYLTLPVARIVADESQNIDS